MTKKELMEALSYHGWEYVEDGHAMEKRDARIRTYTSSETATERMVYSSDGLSFNAPLLCGDISGNRMLIDWDGHKVEVWI